MVERQLIEKELGSLLEMTLKMEDEVNNLGNDLNQILNSRIIITSKYAQ